MSARSRSGGLAALLLAPWLLTACATLSPEECRVVDWSEQGFRDGSAGASESRLNAHAEACARAGILPDAPAWSAGRAEGLRLYCVAEVGYREGLSERPYARVCSGPAEAEFLAGYRAGEDEAYVRRRHQEARDDLRRAEMAYSAAGTDEERARWGYEIRRLRSRLDRIDGFGPGWFW
ncbi:DUF2799 domain-containing protein [Neomegalonema sp.]|uniref:DUF2799 domain-containing protein n=1 Tax=Neomegalonema sp. TaxID=2039713 RepID=UPI00261F7C96|nr:DUF2799 domain-containing protein [Neomegalonema sp.]MDD2868774.1 DUF2799 domain-containing protein [Neomegalonema sp.]